MKTINLILISVLAAALVLVACDNKDKEAEAARLKHIADSLKQDSVRRADEAAAARQAFVADSIRIADSIAAVSKTGKPKPGGKTTKPTVKPAPAAPAKTTPTQPTKEGKMNGQGTQNTETKQQKMGGEAPAANTPSKKQKMGGGN